MSLRIYILISFTLYTINPLFAQTTFNTDSAFQKARTLAFSKQRPEARIIMRKILEIKPAYTEVQTLLARTYAWDGKYDSARIELKQALSYSENNEDATNALIDVELWSDNYQAALDLSNQALKEINPRSEDLLLKKARALSNLGKYKEAYATLQEVLKINPKNEKAISAAETAQAEMRINKIGLSYDYDKYSSTFTPWQGVSAFYSRKTKYLGSVVGRINYAYRFDKPGYQYEVDMYPKLTKKMYSYFNVGFSNASFFPDYRIGFSVYRKLPKSFEAEVGIRYLKFNSPTIIYTGSLGKYYRNFWFSLRPYLIPGSDGLSRSLSLITRYYLKGGSDNYLTLSIGSGISPDQFTRNINLEAPNVNSQTIRLGFQHLFLKRYIFSTGGGFRNDEYRKGSFRENYNFNTSLEMFF